MKKSLRSCLKRNGFFFVLKRKKKWKKRKDAQVRRGGHPYPHFFMEFDLP
jgi:hypothetical protein